MTVGDIIKAVRWCIDEEAVNAANIADVSAFDYEGGAHTDIGLMNNIINLGFKNERVVRFDKCPWNQVVTAVAVGVDKDGNFGEIAMDVFTPTKE